VTVTGNVHSVQQRTEWMNEGASRSIWTFRLDAVDQNGTQLGAIQVEMRGISFEGSLSNGDSVRVTGKWRHGSIRAEQVQNLTTGALVRAKNYRGLMIAALLVFVFGAGAIVYLGIDSSRDAAERREQIQQEQQEIMNQQGDVSDEFCETAKEAGLIPPQCEE
jgi:hypothetical protein